MESDFRKIKFCLVGLGLIGGSYAKALRKIGVKQVQGIDTNHETLRQAMEIGIIDTAAVEGDNRLADADVIIFSLPREAVISFVKAYGCYFKADVLLTDVSGIKADLQDKIKPLLTEHMDFVSGHPMAGREGSGFNQSQSEIFVGANYIVVPDIANRQENVLWLHTFAKALGCATVTDVSAEEHDQLIAYTSSLPHVIAVALVNSDSMEEKTKKFIAGSFRDATRVADINAPLWTKLMMENRENVLTEIKKFQQALRDVEETLISQNTTELMRLLGQAACRRKELMNEAHHR